MEKSRDHYCFLGINEYLLIEESIYWVPIHRPIMTDGNRSGIRWESPKWCFDKYKNTYN